MSDTQTNIILAPADVRAARRETCNGCKFKNKVVPVCNECGCLIPAKVMLVNATCPKDKWAE